MGTFKNNSNRSEHFLVKIQSQVKFWGLAKNFVNLERFFKIAFLSENIIFRAVIVRYVNNRPYDNIIIFFCHFLTKILNF